MSDDLGDDQASIEGHFEMGLRLQIDRQRESGNTKWADWAESLLEGRDITVRRLEHQVKRLLDTLLALPQSKRIIKQLGDEKWRGVDKS